MQPDKKRMGPSSRRGERILDYATVRIRPTRHLPARVIERLGDLFPEAVSDSAFEASGVVLEAPQDGCYYLDVGGVGRFVLKRRKSYFLGITILPRLYCHDVAGNLANRTSRPSEHLPDQPLTAWYDRLMSCEGDLNLWAGCREGGNNKSATRHRDLPQASKEADA